MEKVKDGVVRSVSKCQSHRFHKDICEAILLLQVLGVEGDAHMGKTVKHLSRVAQDPNQPNLRQIHLIHSELFDELEKKGFQVTDGEMGENITTSGIDLLNLPTHTLLMIGESAVVKVTGLRNPCVQLDAFKEGLLQAVLDNDESGMLVRKAGIMGIIIEGGVVKKGDKITICLPEKPHLKLDRV